MQPEVDGFATIFFAPKRRQSPSDHKAMNAVFDQAVARFQQLQNTEEEEAELWRGKIQAFRNLYSFLSQVIPYQDSDLEKLFTYLRHLALKLPKRKTGPGYQFDEEVELDYYRLQKISEGSISLNEGYAKPLDGPREVGTGRHNDNLIPCRGWLWRVLYIYQYLQSTYAILYIRFTCNWAADRRISRLAGVA